MANTTRMLRFWITGLMLAGLGLGTACTTDDSDPADEETGGSGGASGSSTGGSSNGGGSNGGSSNGGSSNGGSSNGGSSNGGSSNGGSATGGTSGSPARACATPVVLPVSSPGIATFDEYDGSADLTTWSFPLGGDVAGGVLAGTFVYGDNAPEPNNTPETYEMVEGNDSEYALAISDTLAEEYGGGMGLWLSACLDARAFEGVSFWVRGNAPNMGTATMSLLMEETTPTTASKPGTCMGIDTGDAPTCVPPKATFMVGEEWAEVELTWAHFSAGKAETTPIVADGHNIWQLQYDIGLSWVDDGTGTYVPTAAPYELVIDGITFF
ncbi:MAG TPA: hypothetical protein VFZ53_29730 [Polyangiaceae bacterium]